MSNIFTENKRKSRLGVIFFGLIIALILALFIIGSYGWFLARQERVLSGAARPTFPYSDYTIAELEIMYPQYANANITTTRTPEDTHRLFMAQLRAGDLEGAVECCVVRGNQEEVENLLKGVRARGQWDLMLSDMSEIKKESLLDTMATYSYLGTYNNAKIGNLIEFIKNNQGIWLIKSF